MARRRTCATSAQRPRAPDGDQAAGARHRSVEAVRHRALSHARTATIVAQLVQAHQTQMHNLITLTNYQTRIALHDEAAKDRAAGLPERPVRAARAVREARRTAAALSALRQRDALPPRWRRGHRHAPRSRASSRRAARATRKGRSLRDFDLRTRIFQYPCSYLIYTDAFDALPEPAKAYVYHRLLEILSGEDDDDDSGSSAAAGPPRHSGDPARDQARPARRMAADYARPDGTASNGTTRP